MHEAAAALLSGTSLHACFDTETPGNRLCSRKIAWGAAKTQLPALPGIRPVKVPPCSMTHHGLMGAMLKLDASLQLMPIVAQKEAEA